MKLYELTGQYEKLLAMAGEDEPPANIQSALEGLKDDIEEKVVACAKVIRSLEVEAEAFEKEAKRLTERRMSLTHHAEHLRSYVQGCMEFGGITKAKGILTVSLAPGPPRVIVDNEEMVPEYFRIVETKILKGELGKFMKEGNAVPGCRLESRMSLRIR